jgi:phosphatidylcholine synthase
VPIVFRIRHHKRRRSGRHWSAWAVHAYTATGAVWAFLAAQAAAIGAFRAAFLWLYIAVVVDSTDGLIARQVRVQERLPDFSGAKLDDIVDYLTFVFVPALIVWRADLVGAAWTVPVAVAMLLTSAYGFVSADAKTADQFFTGFPSYWNVVVLYMVILDPPPLVNIATLLFLSALVFVRIGYVYPTRTRSGRTVTLALSAVWSVMVLVLLIQLPHPSRPLAWISLFFPVYYACLSFALHRRRALP